MSGEIINNPRNTAVVRKEASQINKCISCKKPVWDDDEWVVNWGYCNKCFDKMYKESMHGQKATVIKPVIGQWTDYTPFKMENDDGAKTDC